MRRILFNRKGFSLIELLIASIIGTLVVAGVWFIYLMSSNIWKEGYVQITLQQEAGLAMDKMVWGMDGKNGIREAESVSVPNSYTIEYTSGLDSVERSFYLEDGEILYDPDTSSADDEYAIAEDVSSLTFSQAGGVVTITLNAQQDVRDKYINVPLTTRVKLRN